MDEKFKARDSVGSNGRVTTEADWLDVGDLARRFKSSDRHVFRLADSGRMPWGVKLGQLRRWSRREIEEWEANGCQPVQQRGAGR